MSFYDHRHYRPLLRASAERWKAEKAGATLAKLAAKAGVQAPYLTSTLKERAHLSADQLHALGEALGWDESELTFALLLLEWERSGRPRRREALAARIEAFRQEKLRTQSHLKKQVVDTTSEEFTRFYLNPLYPLVHAFMGVPRFAKEPARIATCLGLSPARVQSLAKDLVEMGFLAFGPKGYAKLRRNFHLPKESALCTPHDQLWMQQVQLQLARLPPEHRYGTNVTFSADPATRERIQREYLKFLAAIEPLVKEAPAEELFGMRFDLFSWSADAGE